MTSRGRFGRWAAARSGPELYRYGVLLVLVGGVAYWNARSRDFWLDPSDRWAPVLFAVAAVPLLAAAIGGVLGWRRGRRSGNAGGLAVFLGGWWFAVTAIILAILRGLVLVVLVIAVAAELRG